jgi:hypothetical protein
MGTFYYLPPIDNVHHMLAIPGQPKDEIFQISLFRTTYFNDLWNLPSPLAMMEGTGHHGMAIPLSMVEVAYSLV